VAFLRRAGLEQHDRTIASTHGRRRLQTPTVRLLRSSSKCSSARRTGSGVK
jgi:hypothetical protein